MDSKYLALLIVLILPQPAFANYGLIQSPLLVAPEYFITSVDTPNLNLTGDVTAEAWVKFTSMPTDRAGIVAKPKNDAYGAYHLELMASGSNYDLRFISSQSGNPFNVVSYDGWNPSIGVWYHIAGTRDGSSGVGTLYVDGVQKAQTVSLSGPVESSEDPLYIGAWGPTHIIPLDGRVSLVRVWNTVRSSSDILNNMCNVYGTATANLQAEWSLDNVLSDASANGYDLMSSGLATFATDTPSICRSKPPPPPSTPGITGAGAVNRLAKFTAPMILSDSLLSDDGSNTTLSAGNLLMQINSMIDTVASGSFNFGTTNATTLTFGRAGQNMIINSRLGIGTDNPIEQLHVSGGVLATSVTAEKQYTATNCASAASPAVCGTASAGSIAMQKGKDLLVVNTSAVTTHSQILITEDSSLGTRLGISCDKGANRNYSISARAPGTSFTIRSSTKPNGSHACLSYWIIN